MTPRHFPIAAVLCLAALPALHAQPRQPRAAACVRISLSGQVNAGQEWNAPIGENWLFRVIPIKNASGWDLVVDRTPAAGYPDALLVATPPYNSINEREIGTTYGLRAQDALGWNPRSFHFLVDPAALRRAQQLFKELNRLSRPPRPGAPAAASPADVRRSQLLANELMTLEGHAATGRFEILDARITPGIADPAPFAQNWAIESQRTQHSLEPAASGQPTPLGEFHWLKFSISLWLPANWQTPKGTQAVKAPCE